MPKVSVIVPVYNVEEYLERCLDSLVNQTLKDIEIIIVNDGSTDGSKEKIQKYINTYKNIVYLEKENGGLSSARNYGIPYAKGEYIGFVDSDDYVELTMYEKMYNKAIEEKSDMVECDFIWEYPNKKREDIGKVYSSKKEAIIEARVVAWNKIIKKDIIEKTKITFPEGLRYEDIEFFYKIVPYLDKISFVKETLVHYVQRESSIANTQNERTGEIFKIWENVLNYYIENNIFNEYRSELEYSYTRILLCSSLKRIIKVKDRKVRKALIKLTWQNLNKKFPHWKQNKYLNSTKSFKNLYLKSINKFIINLL